MSVDMTFVMESRFTRTKERFLEATQTVKPVYTMISARTTGALTAWNEWRTVL